MTKVVNNNIELEHATELYIANNLAILTHAAGGGTELYIAVIYSPLNIYNE